MDCGYFRCCCSYRCRKGRANVKQATISIRSGFELSEKIGQHAVVIRIELRELIHIGPHIGMMGQIVESIADAALRINGSAGLMRVEQR